MNPKPRPNHRAYLATLRRMTPEQRVQKAFELSEFTKHLFMEGLKARFPHLGDSEIRQLYFKRLAKCHNQNY